MTLSFIDGMNTAEDLATRIGDTCTVVVQWNRQAQKYEGYIVGLGTPFTLENGSSYFVFVTADTNVKFSGDLAEPEIDLGFKPGYGTAGWPYVGYHTASDLVADIDGSVALVVSWDAETQQWGDSYITDLGSVDFDIRMGEGVFMFVRNAPARWQVPP